MSKGDLISSPCSFQDYGGVRALFGACKLPKRPRCFSLIVVTLLRPVWDVIRSAPWAQGCSQHFKEPALVALKRRPSTPSCLLWQCIPFMAVPGAALLRAHAVQALLLRPVQAVASPLAVRPPPANAPMRSTDTATLAPSPPAP